MDAVTMEDRLAITEVRKGSFFDQEFPTHSLRTVVDDDELADLEHRTGLKIALAIKYSEYGETRQILIVSTDRRHYKIYF